ncbi:carbohydrate ABC transporter permease [Thermus tengchongensis]|uniref:Sugar ABC transporter permease n=1 Tax=Thermus tengchongensis TaxID=1214928 RepID=A0ABY2K4P9_9DEIN|nr:sugar ABC transporter permease [Thermus tengchongensis]TFU15342.1 sugar ABC transporter permease [Thermus tengchongensis]
MRAYYRFPVLFLLPSLAGFLAFNLGPILASLLLSFVEYDGLRPLTWRTFQENWVGLENYRRLLEDPVFHKAFFNTLFYVAVAVPLEIVLALLLALGLNRPWPGVRLLRTLYLLPTVTSVVAVGLLWRWVLNPTVGPVNLFLRWVGERLVGLFTLLGLEAPGWAVWLAQEGPGWLSDPAWAMWGVILASVWAGVGLRMLIFLAGLQNINKEYLEAASLDGANTFQRFFYVVLPLLTPTVFLNILLAMIGGFQVFGLVYTMTGGGPVDATNVLMLYLYRKAFGTFPFEMGYASAIAWVLFLLLFALTYLQWTLRRRWVVEEA